MKSTMAIMKFFNEGPCLNSELDYPRTTVTELREFKNDCSQDEWEEFGRCACKLLNADFEE